MCYKSFKSGDWEAQNRCQNLFFLVTLWFCLESQKVFFSSFLIFLFTVYVDVSRVTNTELKLPVAVAHVCRRAAFSPHPIIIWPMWLRSVYSFFPLWEIQGIVFFFFLTVATKQNYCRFPCEWVMSMCVCACVLTVMDWCEEVCGVSGDCWVSLVTKDNGNGNGFCCLLT